jgi:hypothetical protein
VGLVAATVVALSPTHILYSKLIRDDVQMTFFLLVAFWFCLNILEERRWRDYLAAGFAVGLAVATKYPAVVFVAPILLAHLDSICWRVRDLARHWNLLVSGAACLVGTFLGSPFLFLDFRTALSDIAHEARPTHLGATGEGLFGNLIWYLRGPLPGALSLFGLILAGIGIVLLLGSGRREGRLLASFPLLFLIFISSLSLRWERWIVPVIPFLCIPLARAISETETWLMQRLNARLASRVGLGLLVVVAGLLLRADVAQGMALSGPDTRTLAGDWMLESIPPGSRVLMEADTPQLPRDAFVFFEVYPDGALARVSLDEIDHWFYHPHGSIGQLQEEDALTDRGIDYVVISNHYDLSVEEGGTYSRRVRTYDTIAQGARLIYEIEGVRTVDAHHRGGPRIRIYEVE